MNTNTPTNTLIANQAQSISRPLSAYQAALAWEDCAELAKKHKGDNHPGLLSEYAQVSSVLCQRGRVRSER